MKPNPKLSSHSRQSLLGFLLFAALALVACAPEVEAPRRTSMLTALGVDPPDEATAIDRVPTIALRFARPMPAITDAVWLVDGPATESLRGDARRGALSTTNATRQLAIDVRRDPADPNVLLVAPRQPLWPSQRVTLLTTARLVDELGLVASESDVEPSPIARSFQVCAAPDCRPLATLVTPTSRAAPFALRSLVIRFDRAIVPSIEAPVVTLVRQRDGDEVPGVGFLSCRDGRLWRCVRFEPDVELEPETEYRLALGALIDSDGRSPSPAAFAVTTGAERSSPRADWIASPACGPGELARAPACVAVAHDRITVFARSDQPAVLRVRAGEWLSESAVGTELEAIITPVAPSAHVPIVAMLVGVDGVVAREVPLGVVATPARVAPVRITEVYARPRGSSAQEFIELVNDGPTAASLGGLAVRTVSGRSELPDVSLPSGARAVVIGPTYDLRGDSRSGDPPIAPGAVVVRLERTLAQRGLADRGGDVWLEDRGGFVVSRAPLSHPARAARVGVSLVRADVRMLEGDPASWSYDAGEGATPGAPDRIR